MEQFYPHSLRKIFTDRKKELKTLNIVKDELKSGKQKHIAIWGLRKIGKTMLLKEFLCQTMREKDIIPVYIDFQEICTSPEMFAQLYIGNICFWCFTKGKGNIDHFQSFPSILKTDTSKIKEVRDLIIDLMNELNKSIPDQAMLFKQALFFPEMLADKIKGKIILIIDEFPEIETFSHYHGIKEPLKLFRAILQKQSNILYIISGSAITVMEKLIQNSKSPLFLQFQQINLSPFDKADTVTLINKLTKGFDKATCNEVYRLCLGLPFYITSLTEKTKDLSTHLDERIDIELVKQAFVLETLSRTGQIYNYCKYLYDISLQKARGYGILKAILRVLAEEEGLTLSEVSKKIRKSNGATSDYLRALIEVDLIKRIENRYYFYDPILRLWIAYTSKGIEVETYPKKEDLTELLIKIEEKYLRTSTELGKAIESKIREIMSKFNNQIIEGKIFNNDDKLILPKFRRIYRYISKDGEIEIDAFGEGKSKWAVEIKWREKIVGLNLLKTFYKKAKPVAEKLWYISKSGFTPEAEIFAKKNGLLLSNREDLEKLSKILECS